ncbi:Calsyntenin-2 Alcadein-gamma [Takifugu flavidus]|uniref:Calsyntenin-2 Alcadein-gamma n=1 Tax=Takifugu flavidus TaxID=433684 RepID=A0A5C6PCL1_9TELE|nr:Calsyntenin-2 Alcadein-gamma [Takifugu flavidus]
MLRAAPEQQPNGSRLIRTSICCTSALANEQLFIGGLVRICDKEWHYYVINVEFPVVTLYVDGVTYDPYLVTDDWPIHPSQIDVQLTVGACWQGGEVKKPRFTQYFRGSLAGLTIRPGKIESQKVISCLQACKEGLDINSLESLDKSIKFHFNPAQSILVMEGEDLENMNAAVRKVSYINSRQFPTPGARRLRISTSVQCFGEDTCITIPDIDAVVMVLQPSEPRITISGAERLTRPESDFGAAGGIALFQDLHIISTVTRADAAAARHTAGQPEVLEEIIHNLDYCDILVLGEELGPEEESLQVRRGALLGKHLDATNSTSGMSVYGVDSMSSYEQVIRQVRYYHRRPAHLTERRFRLTCSELNGRYTSNELNLEVSVLHGSEPGEHVGHAIAPPQYMQVRRPSVVHDLYAGHSSGSGSGSGSQLSPAPSSLSFLPHSPSSLSFLPPSPSALSFLLPPLLLPPPSPSSLSSLPLLPPSSLLLPPSLPLLPPSLSFLPHSPPSLPHLPPSPSSPLPPSLTPSSFLPHSPSSLSSLLPHSSRSFLPPPPSLTFLLPPLLLLHPPSLPFLLPPSLSSLPLLPPPSLLLPPPSPSSLPPPPSLSFLPPSLLSFLLSSLLPPLAAVPSAATVVIVMCIAALVVVVVLGIYRIHLTHQQEIRLEETAKEAGTSWDDSALTITVNPMENLQEPRAEEEAGSEEEDEDEEDEEEDDEITSAESDDSEEEVDIQLPKVERQSRKGQNWDKARISY